MKEHSIIFSTDMVKAILENRKTQTRRVMKPQPVLERGVYRWIPRPLNPKRTGQYVDINVSDHSDLMRGYCPYGKASDTLWVRESWRCEGHGEGGEFAIRYRADNALSIPAIRKYSNGDKWRPSIHMPRWASRISLEILDVRVQRLQEITEEDAQAEGIFKRGYWWDIVGEGDGISDKGARDAFPTIWNTINKKRDFGWDQNPFVWVLTFKRV